MIRVFYSDGTFADLPESTTADPFGQPGADETPATLEEVRRDSKVAFVKLGETWRHARIETWEEEASRLRSELEAAEKRLADLRAWAEGAATAAASEAASAARDEEPMQEHLARGAEGAFQEVVSRIDGKEDSSA